MKIVAEILKKIREQLLPEKPELKWFTRSYSLLNDILIIECEIDV